MIGLRCSEEARQLLLTILRNSPRVLLQLESEDGILHGAECLYHWAFSAVQQSLLTERERSPSDVLLDVFQDPIQPLGHHLSRYFYDTMEKDPVKYNLYQEAMEQVLSSISVNPYQD